MKQIIIELHLIFGHGIISQIAYPKLYLEVSHERDYQ